jgi:KaiC/GvpD/RAD55 family RecA-like ATPase
MMTLNEIKGTSEGEVVIFVDTDTSKENVSRAATSKGWQISDVQPDGLGYRITIVK